MERDAENNTGVVYHYSPELLQLLIDTIPLLCKSKKDVAVFFRGAGVTSPILTELAARIRNDPNNISKYEIARTILVALNEKGEVFLRERREIVRRVTQWEDFSTSWPDDQLKARGLVAQIRQLVEVKDAFTRMNQEREVERSLRLAEERTKQEGIQKRRDELTAIKKELSTLFTQSNPQKRGKTLETVLNRLFEVSGILVREAFTVVGSEGEGIVEQIDGLVDIDGRLYLVEMKWWNQAIGQEISQHIVRLYSRPEAHGIYISASGYTAPAVTVCKEALHQGKMMVLCELREIVLLLEHDQDIKDFLQKKINAAIVHKNPYYVWL
jgi:hypothetical protein